MNFVQINSLPEILFSHFYKTESYQNRFSVRDNYLEISYIAEGVFELQVGKEKFLAKKGDVICFLHNEQTFVSAKGFHCHHTVGARVDWEFSKDEQGLFLPTVTLAHNNAAVICSLIDDFVHNQMIYKTSKALGSAKFLELLCAIDKCNRTVKNNGLPGEVLYTQRAKEYIQQNIHMPVTQKSVAEYLGISPEYLCSVFKRAEGITMMKYINRIKLENIKTLMDNTNIPLYKAANMYGYSDPNYVSRLYKGIFGYNITDKPKFHP